jgi:hypothetical protein
VGGHGGCFLFSRSTPYIQKVLFFHLIISEMDVNTYLCFFIKMVVFAIDKHLHLFINEKIKLCIQMPSFFYKYFKGFFRG